MGQRRRQMREELERREKGVVDGPSGLGPGGEARLEAARREAKLEELRKAGEALREQRSREQKVAWDSARAKAKRQGEAAGVAASDDELEERTVRVKWKRKESHSDYTIDRLFSRFGTVESVSIEAGSGNKALVTFTSPAAADAAVADYKESETMSVRYVGKRRPKRPVFASRPEATSSFPTEDLPSMGSFRDHESVVMMKMRQEAERQALIRKMMEEEGNYLEKDGAKDSGKRKMGGSSTEADGNGSRTGGEKEEGVKDSAPPQGSVESREEGDGEGVNSHLGSAERFSADERAAGNVDYSKSTLPRGSSGGHATVPGGDSDVAGTSHVSESHVSGVSVFPSVDKNGNQARGLSSRENDSPSAMGGEKRPGRSGAHQGSNSTINSGVQHNPTPFGSGEKGTSSSLDENDILARMMLFKK